MGKLLETFRQTTEPAGGPLPRPAEEEVPFIEVGGRQAPMEASPAVLATLPPHPAAGPRFRQLRAPAAEVRAVHFRPVAAERTPAGFAPELVAFHRPEHTVSRQYQTLADAIAEQLPGRGSPLLLFTAAAPGVGATTVVLNLAVTLARRRQGVVVVDAQRDRPAVAERLGLPTAPGLEEVLAGAVPLAEALQETGQEQLVALPAGRGRTRPGARWTADALRRLARQLRDRDGLVFLDAPCWDGRPDLLTLAALCDAVYLVSADGEDVGGLLRDLPGDGVPLRGQILTSR